MTLDLAVPPANTEPWYEWRKGGIGASDLPAIVGCDPWHTEYSLALEKRGEGELREQTPVMAWGHRMERVGIEWYQEMSGLEVVTSETFRNPAFPHLWASLDGRAGRVGVEVKWAAKWSDLPRRIEVQCLGQIGIADLERVDVVRLSPYGEPEVIKVLRDDEMILSLLETGEAWYRRYVLGDELPPVDGSRAASRHLDRLRGEAEMPASPEQGALMAALHDVKRAIPRLEAEEKRLVNELKNTMAGHGSLVGEGFRVSWIATKGRNVTHWDLIAQGLKHLVRPGEWDALVSLHTETGDPGTQFRPKWEEE